MDTLALLRTQPVAFPDGALVIAAGVLLMLVLEGEKILLRRTGALGASP